MDVSIKKLGFWTLVSITWIFLPVNILGAEEKQDSVKVVTVKWDEIKEAFEGVKEASLEELERWANRPFTVKWALGFISGGLKAIEEHLLKYGVKALVPLWGIGEGLSGDIGTSLRPDKESWGRFAIVIDLSHGIKFYDAGIGIIVKENGEFDLLTSPVMEFTDEDERLKERWNDVMKSLKKLAEEKGYRIEVWRGRIVARPLEPKTLEEWTEFTTLGNRIIWEKYGRWIVEMGILKVYKKDLTLDDGKEVRVSVVAVRARGAPDQKDVNDYKYWVIITDKNSGEILAKVAIYDDDVDGTLVGIGIHLVPLKDPNTIKIAVVKGYSTVGKEGPIDEIGLNWIYIEKGGKVKVTRQKDNLKIKVIGAPSPYAGMTDW